MSIKDFMDYCIEPGLCKVEVYDIDTGKTLYSGHGDEIYDELEEMEVQSFDVPSEGCMTFNVSTEE